MMKYNTATATILVVIMTLAVAVMGQTEVKVVIDDFTVEQALNVISTGAITASDPPQTTSSSVTGTGIIGGARDMQLSMTLAPGVNSPLTSNINDGTWSNAVPVQSAGISFIQFDGNDNSINLDTNGLGGIDLTNNDGEEIFVTIRSDLQATYSLFFYSATGNSFCQVDFEVPPGAVDTDFAFEFDSDFDGSCDFGNIGAIEVEADTSERVDSVMSFFGVRGPVPTTQTPTPSVTRTRSPGASAAPSPSPSATRTPDPAEVSNCHCQCPAFTCELIFDPDDDENNAYYFDDDDDNGNAGGSGRSGSSSSGASALKVAFSAGLVVVLAALL